MESGHPSRAFNHAKERARERLGVNLTSRRHKQVLYQIKSGKARFLFTDQKTNREQWLVKIYGKRAKVVFDKRLNLIVTVMYLSREDWGPLNTVASTN